MTGYSNSTGMETGEQQQQQQQQAATETGYNAECSEPAVTSDMEGAMILPVESESNPPLEESPPRDTYPSSGIPESDNGNNNGNNNNNDLRKEEKAITTNGNDDERPLPQETPLRSMPSLMDCLDGGVEENDANESNEEEEEDKIGDTICGIHPNIIRRPRTYAEEGTPLKNSVRNSMMGRNVDASSSPSHVSIHTKTPGAVGPSASIDTQAWNKFVKRGTRLKTFLDDAMHKVADGFSSDTKLDGSVTTTTFAGSKRPLSIIDGEYPDQALPVRSRIDEHAAEIAREKTAEVMILKRKLKEAEANAAAMAVVNSSLREAASTSENRMDRTVEALRIAGTNAANARADADSSEANSASLANQLQCLNSVVEETKRASQVLYNEHDQVSAAARSVEAILLQRESENCRMQKNYKQLLEEREELLQMKQSFQDENRSLSTSLSQNTQELLQIKRKITEQQALEKARLDRSHLMEKELREARVMLVEATGTAAETEATMSVLNDTIQELQRENKTLHERFLSKQNESLMDHERLNDELQEAQKEGQKLRIKVSANEEDLDRLRLDRNAGEKQIAQLKSRIHNVERRLKDATMITSPMPFSPDGVHTTSILNSTSGAGSNHPSLSDFSGKNLLFSIPPLRPTPHKKVGEKENLTPSGSSSNRGCIKPFSKCCLCFKDSGGLMKSCQCGKKECDKRAHAMCLASGKAAPSVSHPGTPAPLLPVVLCGSVL